MLCSLRVNDSLIYLSSILLFVVEELYFHPHLYTFFPGESGQDLLSGGHCFITHYHQPR